eukprot:3358270-Pyramimonas_sp.AAC.1
MPLVVRLLGRAAQATDRVSHEYCHHSAKEKRKQRATLADARSLLSRARLDAAFHDCKLALAVDLRHREDHA